MANLAKNDQHQRLNIGIVGAGYMGQRYAHLAAQHPSTALVGVVDIHQEAAELTCSRYGGSPYASVEALLTSTAIDAVVVATFEDTHVEPCVTALRADVAVLVEKPLASTLEDARAILTAASATSAPLMVGHLLRFDGRYAALHDAVAAGQLGTPLVATARRLNGMSAQDRLKGRSTLPVFLGVHDFDLLRWILDDEVTDVAAVSRDGHLRSLGYPVEDAVFVTLRFTRGAVALVELGWILPAGHPSGFDQRLEITGTSGYGAVAGAFSGFAVATAESTRWPEVTIATTIDEELHGSLERSFNAFVRSARARSTPPVSGLDGLRALEIAQAVHEAATTGRSISLEAARDASA